MIRGSSGRLPKQRFALLWVAIVVALSCVAGIVPHSHSTATAQADLALQASSLLSRQTVLAEPQMRGHSTAGPLQLLAEALIVDEMEPPRYSSWTVLYPFERGGPENGWYDSSWSDDTYAEHAFYTYAGDRWVSEEYNNWGIWTALDGLPYFGEWEVYAYIPRVSTGHSPTSLARYTIRRYPDDSGIPREADQRGGPRWQSLGCYEFDSGIQQAPSVQLVDTSVDYYDGSGRRPVLFDAVKWQYGCESGSGGPVTIDAFLRHYPDGRHFRQGSTVEHCFRVSRAAHVRWWWYNPHQGTSLMAESDYAAGTWCRTDGPLQEVGERQITAQVYEGGVVASDTTSLYVDPAGAVATATPTTTPTVVPSPTLTPSNTPTPTVTGTPRPPKTRAAIMVHGVGLFDLGKLLDPFLGDNCPPAPAAYTGEPDEFGGLAKYLDDNGYWVYLARYPTSPQGTALLETSAGCLRQQIKSVREERHVGKVTLVAHSMGGIVSRRYIEGREYANDVDTLVTYGSPHHGIYETARLLSLLFPHVATVVLKGNFTLCWHHPGLCELDPLLMAPYNWLHPPRQSVNYHLVGGTRGWVVSYLIPGADDGAIAAESASGLNFAAKDTIKVWEWEVDESHNTVMGPENYFAEASQSEQCLAAVLHDNGAGGGCIRAQKSSVALTGATALEDPDEFQYAPLVNGTLPPYGEARVPVAIDGRKVQVPLGYAGGRIQYSLETPSGNAVNPDNVALLLTSGDYVFEEYPEGTGGLAIYKFAAPETGTWFAVIRNASAEEVAYTPFASCASDIRLDVGPLSAVGPSVRVVVRAHVHDAGVGLGGALVDMAVHTAAGKIGAPLVDYGGGQYSGTLTAPEDSGPYQLSVRARGQTHDGVFFDREALLVMAVDVGAGRAIYLPAVSWQ